MYKFFFFIIFILSICSCSKNEISDSDKNNIIQNKKIEKIISLSPGVTDILIDLNEAHKIIAADTFSKDILEKNNINVSNVFDMLNPDAEKIISLDSDIIFINNLTAFYTKNSLLSLSNPTIITITNSETLKGIEDDIYFLGKVLNADDRAKEVVSNMRTKIKEIKDIGDTITNKKTVYFEISALPNLYSFGSNVYLDDIINIIGAKNIFSNRNEWISVSEEDVVYLNPDIIFTSVDYVNNPVAEITNRAAWKDINAVKTSKVFFVEGTSLPTHNIVSSIILMAKYIYPEEYKDIK
ncbi:ABC transporter substrate-binding protein [Brachyspira pilosicoli]|uniref:ABC transporter substrate-binding protein n=1 Tax=Brachyspira pilosicoli TaxID=52584 RepID=A0AAJ6KEG7_BRAPL|nr:ABC transporter substrate-binding protein [Brachyspira pilosicoli]WIH91018.1 ABC transporter substrate-binding protein [Brachyspira pilosicoli]WIH93309.1 ABC transporter substrate-binding protein [Brachyspira pilosicoli]WIH95599.1 ABC transporter substrate-binding protein [Brachyspira pilosicoli]SUW04127.1 iron-compound ABC transporter periplasmic iron compound-binding protein [Brachyspira pilosicoli]